MPFRSLHQDRTIPASCAQLQTVLLAQEFIVHTASDQIVMIICIQFVWLVFPDSYRKLLNVFMKVIE